MPYFQAIDPSIVTAKQLNASSKQEGKRNIGPIHPDGLVVNVTLLMPGDFGDGDAKAIEAKLEKLESDIAANTAATQAIVCATLRPVAAHWVPAGHNIRASAEARVYYEPTVAPE